MSEAERKRRIDYIKNRKRWIMIIAAILGGLILLTVISAGMYYTLNKSYYIDYQEKANVDYTVSLKNNSFYEGTVADKNQAYVASIIDDIIADFNYTFLMSANNVEINYTYSVDALMAITDKNTGAVIFDVKDTVLEKKTFLTTASHISVDEALTVDFEKYNTLEERFIKEYNLSSTVSTLKLMLNVDILGVCDQFSNDSTHHYSIVLNVPLSEQTVVMYSTSENVNTAGQILACGNAIAKTVFLILFIVFAILSVLAVIALIVFSRLTINTDVSYGIRIKKLLRNYKTYIQQINTAFNDEGYQVLMVNSFNEMLEIRDTLQLPIIMNENEDHTCTKFMIPTDSAILYLFEVKIADYDAIYATPVDNEDIDVIVLDENADEVDIVEALHQPDVALDQIDFVDEIDEETDDGIEVVGVVWPEKTKKSKIYRYDPNGKELDDGDIVLVPSRDEAQNKDIIRKATVAHGNHRVDPQTIHHPLKKVIAVIKKKTQDAIMSGTNKTE